MTYLNDFTMAKLELATFPYLNIQFETFDK